MHPGSFFGFAWNVGYPMAFKVIQCNTNPTKRDVVVHRGVVVPRNSSEIGYKSALVPKSDAYLPEVYLKGELPRKPAAPSHQGTMDTSNVAIA